jgi:hypothetical protein
MVSAPEPAPSWSDGCAAPPLLALVRVLDPFVMPFSCCVFLPRVAHCVRKPRPPTPLEKLVRVQRSLRKHYDELLWLRQRVKSNEPKTPELPRPEDRPPARPSDPSRR